jgi:hypothetical protein
MPRFLLLLLTLCLAACAMPKVDPAREAQADRAYELVRRNDAAGVKAMSTPALAGQDLTGVIWQMQAHVHASAPTRARTISWGQNTVNDDAAYEVVRLYTHPAGEVQATVTMLRIGDGPWQIDGLHVLRITPEVLKAYEAEVEAARFTLAGKSPAHYIVLVGTGLSVLVCLVSAAVAGWRRRWGWMVGNLFGIGKVALNWTTGALFFQPLYVALLGAGFFKGLGATDPWIFSVSLPIPALLFWGLGKWRKKAPKAKTSRVEPASGTPDL